MNLRVARAHEAIAVNDPLAPADSLAVEVDIGSGDPMADPVLTTAHLGIDRIGKRERAGNVQRAGALRQHISEGHEPRGELQRQLQRVRREAGIRCSNSAAAAATAGDAMLLPESTKYLRLPGRPGDLEIGEFSKQPAAR